MTDYSNQIVETKKKYVLDYEGNDDVSISAFAPTKKKPLIVTLNNTGENPHSFSSSTNYKETIIVSDDTKNHYSIYLNGTKSNKTVKLGNTSGNIVNVSNSGKNTITAGDGGNNFQTDNADSNNTITSGKGRDSYSLKNGTTKITDKGTGDCGKDNYYIYGGKNTVVDKGGVNVFRFRDKATYSGKYTSGAGEDTFEFDITGSQGEVTISSGDGVDTLNIYNNTAGTNDVLVNADLGKGNDVVLVDYKDGSTTKNNSSILNVKTGKGEDTVRIYAGKKNDINTGDGDDTISVNNTAENTVSTIKAGKGNDDIAVAEGTNTIYGEAGKDSIQTWGGTNTIYGGNDTIDAHKGTNTIYAYADTVNLKNGDNTVYTKKGGNTINVITPTDIPANVSHTIHLDKGNNTVNIEGTADAHATAKIYVSAGKNTINATGYSNVFLFRPDKTYKTAQKVTLSEHAVAQNIWLGNGADIITNSSSDNEQLEYAGTHAGGGNDKFYISKGSNKKLYGEDGNDYFEIRGTDNAIADGGKGNDTFDIYHGSDNQITGGEGNDKFTIYYGNKVIVSGDKGKDTFNIKGGTSCTINGGDANDTFNIYSGGTSGTPNFVFGQNGNDTYNLYMQEGVVMIYDNAGKNTINVKQNFKGIASIVNYGVAERNLNFDKSYKLTTSANIVDNVIVTSDSNITLYRFFEYNKDTQTGDFDQGVQLVTNVKEAIEDGDISNDRYIGFSPEAIASIKVGGKNYTLNLDQLQQDLVGWFNNHNTYANTGAVLSGGNETDINSLMAIYTQDTAGCFVK